MLKHWKYNIAVITLGCLALLAVNTWPWHHSKSLRMDPAVIDYVNGIEVKWIRGETIGCEMILMNNRLTGKPYKGYTIDYSLSIDNGQDIAAMVESFGTEADRIINAKITDSEYIRTNITNDLRLLGIYRIRNADDEVVYLGHVRSEWSNFGSKVMTENRMSNQQ